MQSHLVRLEYNDSLPTGWIESYSSEQREGNLVYFVSYSEFKKIMWTEKLFVAVKASPTLLRQEAAAASLVGEGCAIICMYK